MLRLLASLLRWTCMIALAANLLAACRGPLTAFPDCAGQPIAPAATLTLFVPQPFPTHAVPATATPAPTPLPRLEKPILWYLRGTAPPDLPAVNEQFNRLLAERGFNAQVELYPIQPAVFERRMAEILAADEPWDIVSLTGSRYAAWAEKGVLLPLVDQTENRLELNAPRLWSSLPPAAWQAARIHGVVYAVTNQGVWARTRGVSIRADVVQALGLQAAVDRLRTLDNLTPLLAQIQSAWQTGALGEKGVVDAKKISSLMGQADLLQPETAGYDLLVDPFAVRYNDAGLKIVNWYQTPEFQALARLRRAWQEAGYLPAVAPDPDAALKGYRTGSYLIAVGSQVYPGSALDRSAQMGYTWVDHPLAPTFLKTPTVNASVTGISAGLASDPERVRRVIMLLEWLHNDTDLYNLLANGIEGQHWSWVDRQRKEIRLASGSGYLPDFTGQLGDQTLTYATSSQQPEAWQAVRQANASAPASVALGFRFDPKPVGGEVFAMQGLLPELLDPLANGRFKDVEKAISSLNKTLLDSGVQSVQEELVRQLSQWKQGQ